MRWSQDDSARLFHAGESSNAWISCCHCHNSRAKSGAASATGCPSGCRSAAAKGRRSAVRIHRSTRSESGAPRSPQPGQHLDSHWASCIDAGSRIVRPVVDAPANNEAQSGGRRQRRTAGTNARWPRAVTAPDPVRVRSQRLQAACASSATPTELHRWRDSEARAGARGGNSR